MKYVRGTTLLCALAAIGLLAGCRAEGFGKDGSIHPDPTEGIADYTGQGSSGEGWAGDSSGEGGPSAEQPLADTRLPR
jgi:hypothetical protein